MNSKQMIALALAGVMSIGSLMASEQEERRASSNRRERYQKQPAGNNKKQPSAKQKRRMLHYLNANYPTEIKAIKKLQKTDPAEAKEKIKALVEKGMAKIKAERKAIFTLVKKYRETKDEAVLDKIRAKISANYDKRIEYAEKVVAKLEQGLDKAKDKLQELKSKREGTIDKIIDRVKNSKGRARGKRKKPDSGF